LPTGQVEVSLLAGVSRTWDGLTGAFVRGELGWHPVVPLTVFAYSQADLVGLQAGAGARLTW